MYMHVGIILTGLVRERDVNAIVFMGMGAIVSAFYSTLWWRLAFY